jgi:signal transduction histidine kinase
LEENNLVNITQTAVDYCRAKADERGIAFSTDMPDNPVNCRIDGFALQRAFVNLINNAVEASEPDQAVTVSLQTSGRYHAIRIKDVGSGMDRETLENIFVPFYTKKRGGTGLGMVIAKKIIEGHKGRINVDSKAGEGTQITIELPVKETF